MSFIGMDRRTAESFSPLFAATSAGVIALVLASVARPWLRGQREIGRLLAAARDRRPPGARP